MSSTVRQRGIPRVGQHLELANVWIPGCEQGVLPSCRSNDFEEERRLFYVGMTRAKSHLVLSWAGIDIEARSRFLWEAGL